MKQKLKSVCKKCGNIELEKTGILRKTLRVFKSLTISLIIFLSVFGAGAWYNLINGEILGNTEILLTIGGLYATINNFKDNFVSKEDTEYYKNYTSEMIKDCEDDECKARKIYNYLLDFEYDWGDSDTFDPREIIRRRKGDCDQMSITYVALLHANNIKAIMQCNTNHCWSVIKLKDKTILADIVQTRWEEY